MIKIILPLTTIGWGSASTDYRLAVAHMAAAVSRAQLGVAVFVHTSDGPAPVVVRGGLSGPVG